LQNQSNYGQYTPVMSQNNFISNYNTKPPQYESNFGIQNYISGYSGQQQMDYSQMSGYKTNQYSMQKQGSYDVPTDDIPTDNLNLNIDTEASIQE